MYIEKKLAQTQSFSELLPVVRQAEAKLSCLGSNYVSVKGYDGSLSIYALSTRVTELVEKNFEFDEDERKCGKEIASLVNHLYTKGDQLLHESCCLTRILHLIRTMLVRLFTGECMYPSPRFHWERYDNRDFEQYTRNQFTKAFGKPPGPGSSYTSAGGQPNRYHVPNPNDLSQFGYWVL